MPGHQSRHPVAAGRLTGIAQFLVHPRHAHHAIAGLVAPANPHQQALVVGLAGTRRPLAPGMEAAGRHLQTSTHQLIATVLDRLIFQLDSLVKNAAASRKKSLFLHPGQFASLAISMVTRHARAGEGLRLGHLQLAPPTTQNPGAHADVAGYLTDVGTRLTVTPTASRLNLPLNFLRLTLLFTDRRPFLEVSALNNAKN
jgi:hypothetical protein